MQDIEFTIEKGKLYIFQTRNGKRTSQAAVRIAVEMVENGMISKETALMRVEPSSLNQLLHKQLDNNSKKNMKVLAKGLPASPGAAVGRVVFSAEDAEKLATKKEKVVLVRLETSPEDIEGMHSSQGILTGRGGMTSHAAVVARGMGKCCVAGCSDLIINEIEKIIEINGARIREGEFITLDGSSGEIFLGKLELVEPILSGNFGKIMQWADEYRKIGVRTNADTPKDASTAIKFGAEGIGLCRTEHMFFEESRIKVMREMILSNTKQERERALLKLLPMQRGDFYSLFQIMNGLPVTIRFLDPPLHEFLPKEEDKIQELAREMGVSVEVLKDKTAELHEFNPMLGHRGCRLGITFPEITEMQSRAVFEADSEIIKEGKSIVPEIMIPIVGNIKEFEHQKKIVDETARKVMRENNVLIEYKTGTMIEVPRAAVTADELAEKAEFFSFGTNDLTQMGCGFSRDDSAKFLKEYVELGIYKRDPFETIEFCHKIGLSYVSCSPFRVPIARLAGAQSSIKEKKKIEENAYKKMIKESIIEIRNKFGERISIDELENELYKKINPKAVENLFTQEILQN